MRTEPFLLATASTVLFLACGGSSANGIAGGVGGSSSAGTGPTASSSGGPASGSGHSSTAASSSGATGGSGAGGSVSGGGGSAAGGGAGSGGAPCTIPPASPAGALDPSFVNGLVTPPASLPFGLYASALTVDAQGRTLIAGESFVVNVGNLPAIIRLDASGASDPSFGDAGSVQFMDTTLSNGAVSAIAIDGSGRIVVGGGVPGTLFFLRFTPDGQVDTSFGTAGKTLVPNTSGLAYLTLTFQGDAFYVTGTDSVPESGPLVARILPTGAVDTSFKPPSAAVAGVGPEPGGIVYGTASGTGPELAKMTLSGAPIPTFGKNGNVLLTSTAANASVNGAWLAPLSDGSVIVSGTTYPTGVARVTKSGAVDTTFADAGFFFAQGTGNYGAAFARLCDGRIELAGGDAGAFAMLRLLPDGSPDTTLGPQGTKTVAYPTGVTGLDSRFIDPTTGKVTGLAYANGQFWVMRVNP